MFWASGATASNGIEQMAETGGASLMVNDVTQQLTAGNANQFLTLAAPAHSDRRLASSRCRSPRSIDALLTGPTFTGGSAIVFVTLPNQSALLGQEFFCQGLLASNRVGLTRGLAIRIGN
ncbi:MAG: hypothetical protein ACI9S9_003371 [Planctomycetota bacterium]